MLQLLLAFSAVAGLVLPAHGEVLLGDTTSEDLHVGAEWLVGRFVKLKAGIDMERLPQGIATPGIWDGLPSDAVNMGGFLLQFEGNVESSQKLGVDYYRINGKYYFKFNNISNDSYGQAEDRILDALRSPWGNIMRPCSVDGVESDQAFAFPDVSEARTVLAQEPSMMNGVRARLVQPRHSYLFSAKNLKISRIESARVKCFGFMRSIVPD